MNILQKLTSIIKIENKLPKLKNFQIHLFSDNTSQKISIDNRRTVNINLNIQKLDQEETINLKKLIGAAVRENDTLAIDIDAKNTLESFKQIDGEKENREIIEYFSPYLSKSDIEILRASIYIKKLFDQKKSIDNLKRDIINRYGDRGKNISNLYSAGYFSSLIKPICEEMKKQHDFTAEKFSKHFNIIVSQYPFAVFVNKYMSRNEIEKELLQKMKINLKYGIHHMNIHGIGRENVEKIHGVLNKLNDKFSSLPELYSKNNYINAIIHF